MGMGCMGRLLGHISDTGFDGMCARAGQLRAAGRCSPPRGQTDGRMDRRSVARAKVTTEPAGGAAWQRRETGWQRGWWGGWIKLQMAGEVAGNDAHERGAAVPYRPHGAGGDMGLQPWLALPPPCNPLPRLPAPLAYPRR